MFEECTTQMGAIAHAASDSPRLTAHLFEVLADEVRHQVGSRQMGPEVFHGVEFGRIGRQVFHCQPRGLLPQIGLHVAAAMRRQPIPEQNRLSPSKLTLQGPQVIENLRLFDRAGMKSQAKSDPTSRRRGCQTGNGREPFPVERRDHDRGLSPRAPRAPHRWTLGKAAFVQEYQHGPRVARFFLIRGQRYFSHRRIAASSRSRARRSGRWQLHPNRTKSFQT